MTDSPGSLAAAKRLLRRWLANEREWLPIRWANEKERLTRETEALLATPAQPEEPSDATNV